MSAPDNTTETTTEFDSANGHQNPGLPYHRPRRADVDDKADKRAERQTAALFGLSIVGTVLAIWAYFGMDFGDGGDISAIRYTNMLIGLGVFMAMIGIGLGAIHWAKTLMRDHEMIEERAPMRSSDEGREGAIQNLKDGAEDSGLGGVKRRGLLKGTLITALAIAP